MPAAVLCQVGGGDGQAGPLHGCHRSQMFLGLAPDFAVEEGSKDEPEGQVVVELVTLVILTANTYHHTPSCVLNPLSTNRRKDPMKCKVYHIFISTLQKTLRIIETK